ncbi:MAG: hypothetical protein HZB23_03335 [Deltaproteobacteria bacterium]|nr:hypothetical protein [Deltaproteobacteria bacterium]
MEITCPSCSAGFESSPDDGFMLCPSCGAELLVEDRGEGYLLVSASESVPQKKPKANPDEPTPENDPLVADYTKWRQGGFFSFLLGASGILMICLATYHDYNSYGKTFLMSPGNRFFLSAVAAFFGLLLIAGGIVFRIAGRERRRYLDAWKASPVKIEHPPTSETP